MTTALQLLKLLRANCDVQADQSYAEALDTTTGDDRSRAIATGRYGTYTAIAKSIARDLDAGLADDYVTMAEERSAASHQAWLAAQQLAELGRLLFAASRGDVQAAARTAEILLPYIPSDELARLGGPKVQ